MGLLLFLGVLLVAILAGVLSPYDPYYLSDDLLMPPGSENHPLGTDHMGHDVLSMILHGSRTSLTIGIVSALISGLIGTMLGAFAGYFGGALDKITSEVINIFLMIPTFFLVLIIVSIFGSNMFNVMLVIGLTSWPSNARMMRVQAMSLKERTYIKGAVVMGESRLRILFKYIIPNGLFPVIANTTMGVAKAILTEASLSFLGLGDPNIVSWGQMVYRRQGLPADRLVDLHSARPVHYDDRGYLLYDRRWPELCAQPPDEEIVREGNGLLLNVQELCVSYLTKKTELKAVDHVSFGIERGDTLGIIGESGSGKSTIVMAMLRQLDPRFSKITGRVEFDGQELLTLPDAEFKKLLWKRIAIVFQKSMNSLSPVHRLGSQFEDIYRVHEPHATKAQIHDRAVELFKLVNLPERVYRLYPHELSGGMMQRFSIVLSADVQPRPAHHGRGYDGAGRGHAGAAPAGDHEAGSGTEPDPHHDHPRPFRGGQRLPQNAGTVLRSGDGIRHVWSRSSSGICTPTPRG